MTAGTVQLPDTEVKNCAVVLVSAYPDQLNESAWVTLPTTCGVRPGTGMFGCSWRIPAMAAARARARKLALSGRLATVAAWAELRAEVPPDPLARSTAATAPMAHSPARPLRTENLMEPIPLVV